MPKHLIKGYLLSETYTEGQVKKTMEKMGLGNSFQGYAYVAYLKPEAAIELLGSEDLYIELRNEISAEFLNGETDFRKLFEPFKTSENYANDSIGGMCGGD